MQSELADRTLFFDGESAWTEDALLKSILAGVDVGNPKTKTKIAGYRVKNECGALPEKRWCIPQPYLDIDLDELFDELSHDKGDEATTRVKYELALFRKHGLVDVLYLMCFIRDKLTRDNIVWGVGRGSSVSSYLLYLLDIHLIDSVKYDLDIHDFIRL